MPKAWEESLNSLWPSDIKWRQGSRSTLAQVMACCLMAPSHYLNQCWLIISKVQRLSSEGNFTKDASATPITQISLKDYLSKISFKSPRGQWVNINLYMEKGMPLTEDTVEASPIQIWPSCCFFVPSAARVRFQNRLKSRGGCATKMLRTEIIELLNASNKSTHVLCIDRKLRSFWVEWRSYHICRCSRTYILNNLIHQLHNVFSLRRTWRCTDSRSNHWSGIQVARASCQDGRATTARMSLKAGTADSMHRNNGEHFTKASCSKL